MDNLFELTSWAGTVEQALIQAVATLDVEEGGMYVIARADLDNPDDVRVAAVDTIAPLALNHVGLRGPAREALRGQLADRLQSVRLHAAEGFGLLGVDADIEQLEEQLELESDDEVKDALQAALRQIRGRASGTQIGR